MGVRGEGGRCGIGRVQADQSGGQMSHLRPWPGEDLWVQSCSVSFSSVLVASTTLSLVSSEGHSFEVDGA